jgi:hypothetical protein
MTRRITLSGKVRQQLAGSLRVRLRRLVSLLSAAHLARRDHLHRFRNLLGTFD